MNPISPKLPAGLALPGDAGDGPHFAQPYLAQPWQARIFAIVAAMAEAGRFPWALFQQRLIAEIQGGSGDPAHYYDHWLAAAEKLLAEVGALGAAAIDTRANALAQATRQEKS